MFSQPKPDILSASLHSVMTETVETLALACNKTTQKPQVGQDRELG